MQDCNPSLASVEGSTATNALRAPSVNRSATLHEHRSRDDGRRLGPQYSTWQPDHGHPSSVANAAFVAAEATLGPDQHGTWGRAEFAQGSTVSMDSEVQPVLGSVPITFTVWTEPSPQLTIAHVAVAPSRLVPRAGGSELHRMPTIRRQGVEDTT